MEGVHPVRNPTCDYAIIRTLQNSISVQLVSLHRTA